MKIVDPLSVTHKKAHISDVLLKLASQENCDGEPYDQMVEAAEYIVRLERLLASPHNRKFYISAHPVDSARHQDLGFVKPTQVGSILNRLRNEGHIKIHVDCSQDEIRIHCNKK